ncbi:MAG: bacteriohopanetetrol glucosamine biosynthesis glycosyltransferase HpnI [Alphaproteobacteria bacterium]|nr:bacteriohopanetetrol glucosamine biosynthesis glycosyltransferase HpnI [Alphaproteobacteria bacterium]
MNLTVAIIVLLIFGWLCLAGQVLAVLRFARRPLATMTPADQQPVSVLKPLHGDEPGLYENLRSFLDQDYAAAVQIVLGVNDPEDTGLDAARALVDAFPEHDIELVVDRRIRGSNQKVSNLESMLPSARHDILVLSDSDMRVDRDYLRLLTPPLQDGHVGAVTCLYKGVSTGGLWSDLGALQINFGFLPNAVAGEALGVGGGCFGATIALARGTLADIGGFARFRDELADDHRIGDGVRARGLSVELSRYLVDAQVYEPSFAALWRHELRWARTMRQLAPAGFVGSVITYPVALAILAAAGTGFSSVGCTLLTITVLARWAMTAAISRLLGLSVRALWLLPLRDCLSFAVFVASFLGRRVRWRDQNLYVEPSGRMTVAD